jgi:hypothetical protein
LTALYEQDGQEWAKKMRSLLAEIKKAVERAKEPGRFRLSPLLEMHFEARYQKLLRQDYAATPPPPVQTGHNARADQQHQDQEIRIGSQQMKEAARSIARSGRKFHGLSSPFCYSALLSRWTARSQYQSNKPPRQLRE